jgi:hypothetical protein
MVGSPQKRLNRQYKTGRSPRPHQPQNPRYSLEIRLDNGWCIKIGRGLDFYQHPLSRFGVGVNDLSLRKCLETKVDIFRQKGGHAV